MQKIPTMYERDESLRGHPVIDKIKPECVWVAAREGYGTIKIDGANVKVQGGQLLKRQKPKSGDYDEASYVPCVPGSPDDKWLWAARACSGPVADGVYEAVGPKIQCNPHGLTEHRLISVVPPAAELIFLERVPRTFDELRQFLSERPYEGIVFHHHDGRMAKIKRRDFGLPWPLSGK